MSEPAPETPAAPAAPAAPETPAGDPAPEADQGNVDELPEWARNAITKANREAANYRTKFKEAEPQLQQLAALEEASKSELEKATETASKAAARADAADQRAVKAEIRSRAADAFVERNVPFAYLPDLKKYVTESGDIDEPAIQADLDKVLVDHPELRRVDRRVPAPNPALGSSGGGAPNLDDQIAEAQKSGDTRRAIHLQNQKLAAQSGG